MESNKNSVFITRDEAIDLLFSSGDDKHKEDVFDKYGNYVFPFENNGLNPNTASSANTFYDIDYLSLLLSRD